VSGDWTSKTLSYLQLWNAVHFVWVIFDSQRFELDVQHHESMSPWIYFFWLSSQWISHQGTEFLPGLIIGDRPEDGPWAGVGAEVGWANLHATFIWGPHRPGFPSNLQFKLVWVQFVNHKWASCKCFFCTRWKFPTSAFPSIFKLSYAIHGKKRWN